MPLSSTNPIPVGPKNVEEGFSDWITGADEFEHIFMQLDLREGAVAVILQDSIDNGANAHDITVIDALTPGVSLDVANERAVGPLIRVKWLNRGTPGLPPNFGVSLYGKV